MHIKEIRHRNNKKIYTIGFCGLVVLAVIIVAIFLIPKTGDGGEAKITSFRYSYSSSNDRYYTCNIDVEEDGKIIFSADGVDEYESIVIDEDKEISSSYLDKIEQIIDEERIYNWDGFNKRDDEILDGYNFHLEVRYKDDKLIKASGYSMYPDNYESGHRALMNFLKSI